MRLKAYASFIRQRSANLVGPVTIEGLIGILPIPGGQVIGLGGTLMGFIAMVEAGIPGGGIFDFDGWADYVDQYADLILAANKDSSSGIIISLADQGDAFGDYCGGGCHVTVVSSDTGNGGTFVMPGGPGRLLFRGGGTVGGLRSGKGSVWLAGHACTYEGGNPSAGNYYTGDHSLCK